MEIRRTPPHIGRHDIQAAGMTAIIDLTAGEIAAAVAGGRLTAEAVMTAFLDRIAAVNGAVNAICTLNPNALADARAADARLAAVRRRGRWRASRCWSRTISKRRDC